MEKPPHLYHGSPTRSIEAFEPRKETKRHPEEGPVIFAAPDRAAATKNLFPSRDDWTYLATINGVHVALIAQDRETFIQNDHGGSIYHLPSETFEDDPKFRGAVKPGREWTSRTSVQPTTEEKFPSALDAMINEGVQVYFVEPDMLSRMRETEEKAALLETMISENQYRGVGVKSFH